MLKIGALWQKKYKYFGYNRLFDTFICPFCGKENEIDIFAYNNNILQLHPVKSCKHCEIENTKSVHKNRQFKFICRLGDK